MLKCRETCVLLSESQDRELNIAEKVQVYLHLAICPQCRRYRKQLNDLRDNLRQWQKE
ncbi:MAG: zf-HC2 domain-containing protein [Neisseria sp.]|nr:zf-HC2 domain-containing protein [Neisseria sp.]